MPIPPPRVAAIIGPGLLGGSIVLALRECSPETEIRVWARRQEATTEVAQRTLCHLATTDLTAACAGADLVILCTPMWAMAPLSRQFSTSLAPGCVVTDVGSAKSHVVASLEGIFEKSPASFVGSHPMAGSERTGLEAARHDLFQGAVCILTPSLFTTEDALHRTRAFWELLGCRALEMSPEEHDRKVSRISHMPHLCAAAITRAALLGDPSAAQCAGNGFRDTTRVAAGDPDLWSGIIAENREEILASVIDARNALSDLVAILENMDERALRRFLAEAKTLRENLPEKA